MNLIDPAFVGFDDRIAENEIGIVRKDGSIDCYVLGDDKPSRTLPPRCGFCDQIGGPCPLHEDAFADVRAQDET